MKEQATMDDYQKAYIELIAQKTADHIAEKLEAKIAEQLEKSGEKQNKIDMRLQQVERKVFNGFGLRLDKLKWQIGLLYGIYTIMLATLIKLAFFH